MTDLTQEDIETLKYFWNEKEDIERYSDFEKIKPQLKKQFPELLKAWNNYKVSIKIMNAVIDSIKLKK